MPTLTERQRAIFEFIVGRVHHEGIPPTLMEIAEAFGLASVAGVADHLKAIERKGFIRRRPGASRGIEVADDTRTARASGVWLPLAGRVPTATWDPRSAPPAGILVDRRLAPVDAFVISLATVALQRRGLMRGDLLIVAPDDNPAAASLMVGRQGRQASLLEIGADARRALPVAGRFDASRDVDLLGRVVGVVRGLEPDLAASGGAETERDRLRPMNERRS